MTDLPSNMSWTENRWVTMDASILNGKVALVPWQFIGDGKIQMLVPIKVNATFTRTNEPTPDLSI